MQRYLAYNGYILHDEKYVDCTLMLNVEIIVKYESHNLNFNSCDYLGMIVINCVVFNKICLPDFFDFFSSFVLNIS